MSTLDLYTEFEIATAQQLAYERSRDEPSEKDLADAVKMVARWGQARIKAGLRPWS